MTWRRWQAILAAAAAVAVAAGITAGWRVRERSRATAGGPVAAKAGAPVDAGPNRLILHGRVVDAAGAPVAGAQVVWLDAAVPGQPSAIHPAGELGTYAGPLPFARTAATMQMNGGTSSAGDGSFALEVPPGATGRLFSEHAAAGQAELSLATASPPNPLTITLRPVPPRPVTDPASAEAGPASASGVRFLVRDRATGAVLANARVEVAGETAIASAPGYASARAQVPPETREVVIELALAASVTGRVLDARGDPVTNAVIDADGKSARSDARGEFAVRGLHPGHVLVRARTAQAAGETEVDLLPGERRRDLDLRLAP
jgi:hypothetical protein